MTRGRLLAGGAALLLAALVSWVALAATQWDGYRWAEESWVPVDGTPHLVELGSDRPAMLWAYEADRAPRCRVVTATGDLLPLSPVDGGYRRAGGSAGDWVGLATFEPRSASAEVTCTLGDEECCLVAVETAPVLPPVLAGLGAWGAVPGGLGLAGLLAVVAAVVLGVRRR